MLLMAGEEASNFASTVVPWIAPGVAALLGIVTVLVGIHNRRKGALETRAPDVNEIWQRSERQQGQLDSERRHRRTLEDYAANVRGAFRGYIRRVQDGGLADLTTTEQLWRDSEIPSPPKE